MTHALSTFFPILFSGLAAGALHVFMGPDHLAAVAPLAINQRKRPWILGVRWGFGHASGVILVAVLAWLAREVVPVELLSAKCERLVGVMLIAIGIWGLRKAFRAGKFELHFHEHTHDGHAHHHFHVHDFARQRGHGGHGKHVHTHAALAVGILHGLAGGSHFLGVLPALALPTRLDAAAYLLAFGAGTVVAMGVFSGAFGLLGRKFEDRGVLWIRNAMVTCSGLTILVGTYWLFQQG